LFLEGWLFGLLLLRKGEGVEWGWEARSEDMVGLGGGDGSWIYDGEDESWFGRRIGGVVVVDVPGRRKENLKILKSAS
jgi:hypothetical protein